MSWPAFLGAIELGLVFGLVGIGVYLSFRVLNFPDLTVDGSFPLGAAVSAALIVGGTDPYIATGLAMLAGAVAGLVTAALNLRFQILHLLASILTMIALYTINLRIMGKPNVALLMEPTVLTPLETIGLSVMLLKPLFAFLVVVVVAVAVIAFLTSEVGLAMRATGANRRMARAQGIGTDATTYAGMALSNALVALAGALFAQMNGFADVTIGVGTIVVGLAAVIVGEVVLPSTRVALAVLGCLIGSLVYRLAVATALNADFIGLTSADLNLVTAVLVAAALILGNRRGQIGAWIGRRTTVGGIARNGPVRNAAAHTGTTGPPLATTTSNAEARGKGGAE